MPLYPKQKAQLSAAHRTPLWRTRTVAAALLLSCGLAFAQHPGTPAVEPPRQTGGGGGGVGIGINIDLGSLFNAIKNATKKDEQTKPPVLQKKAVSVSSGNSGNYTVDWVVQYANNTSLPQTSVTVVDGPIATIIPGSLQQPPGWSGATNANPPADNYAKWTGAIVPPHGFMTATMATTGSGNIVVGGSGDGFHPIPFVHSTGRRTYIMNHHASAGLQSFICINMATGAACTASSGTWPRALPFGDNSSNSSLTMGNNSEYVMDGSKFYYPAQNLSKWGIGCFDLETETQCGYTALGTSSGSPNNRILQGPWRVGNELYLADYDGQMYCARIAVGMPACTGSNYKIPLTDIKLSVPSKLGKTDAVIENTRSGVHAARVAGSKLYITTLSGWEGELGITKSTNCLDSVTKRACWSYTTPTKGTSPHTYLNPYGPLNLSNFIYYSNSGIAQAICSKIGVAPWQECTDLGTGLQTTLPRIFPSHPERTSLEVHVWPYSYFTYTGGPTFTNKAFCWNWSTGNYCNGTVDHIASTSAVSWDYGNNIDDRGCIWTNGHYNQLWGYDPSNIDPVTKKALPCAGDSGKATKVFQPLTYCSGPKPFHWTGVEIKSATLANFDKVIVKVLDSTNNAVLLTKDLKIANTLLADITSIDAQTLSKPLKIEVEYTPKAGTSDKPYIEVRYNAPAPEFCFQSTHTCKQDKITNVVETPDPANPSKIISVKVDVNKPQVCPIIEPPPPVCGQAGQPPCPLCGTATTPACPACGQPGQPPCPACVLGTPGCNPPPPVCIPGSPNCPIVIIGGGCIPGTFNCPPRPPVVRDPLCLTADCTTDKPKQSVAEEYKEPKVSCARKPKPVAEEPKKVAPKPRPKPAVVAAPVAVDPNAPPPPPKPKPKPRPKPVQAKPAAEDDCE